MSAQHGGNGLKLKEKLQKKILTQELLVMV